MKQLFKTDMPTLIGILEQVKECQDECVKDIRPYFSGISLCYEDYEMETYEEMSGLTECKGYEYLYYEEQPTEDSESYGEAWSFSSDAMSEYYNLLFRLKKNKVISKAIYEIKILEVEGHIKRYLFSDKRYTYGVGGELLFRRGKKKVSSIKIYLDYNYVFSYLSVYCAVIQIFDMYEQKLQELKDTYLTQREVLEAA